MVRVSIEVTDQQNLEADICPERESQARLGYSKTPKVTNI